MEIAHRYPLTRPTDPTVNTTRLTLPDLFCRVLVRVLPGISIAQDSPLVFGGSAPSRKPLCRIARVVIPYETPSWHRAFTLPLSGFRRLTARPGRPALSDSLARVMKLQGPAAACR